jgi:ABC-type polar amino acid transport system ATPase subunit
VLVGELFKKFGLFVHTEVHENAIRELRAITESAFQEAFQQWKKRWERRIASRGDYFEGDSA